jgi:hypothetical protein
MTIFVLTNQPFKLFTTLELMKYRLTRIHEVTLIIWTYEATLTSRTHEVLLIPRTHEVLLITRAYEVVFFVMCNNLMNKLLLF